MSISQPDLLQQVIRFEYLQSLAWQGDSRWSELVEARVTMTDAALSSGWLREHFTGRKGGVTDFVILLSIVMHAQPLMGNDLEYLQTLKMATSEDEGRLYARITDLGLADELGMHRTTIAKSAQRLANSDFISILEIPEQLTAFRDSHGQFAGSKVYLLSGEIAQFLPKALHPLSDHHRVISSDTDGVGLTDTVSAEIGATVSLQPTHHVGSTDTNSRLEDRGGEEVFNATGEKIDCHTVFAAFAKLLGREYQPNAKDLETLQALASEGYTTTDILIVMQRVANNLGGSLSVARTFGYLLPEIRRQPPHTSTDQFDPDPTGSDGSASGSIPDTDSASEERSAAHADPSQTSEIPLPEEVRTAFLQVVGRVPSPVEAQRLAWLQAELNEYRPDSAPDAWDRIVEALKFHLNPQANQPVAYLRKVLTKTEKNTQTEKASKARLSDSQGKSMIVIPQENLPQVAGRKPLVPSNHDDHYPVIQVGGLALTRPKERASNYVIPAEENLRNLYDFAAWLSDQEDQGLTQT